MQNSIQKNGAVRVEWTLSDFIAQKPEVILRWIARDFDDENLNILFLTEYAAKELVANLQHALTEMEEKRRRIEEITSKTNFTRLYQQFEDKYNKYPVQMSRAEAFGRAHADGLIDDDTYDAAYMYYKRLWNYVGD